MYPLNVISSMQEFGLCSYLRIIIGIIDSLIHFQQDDTIPYNISSKGNLPTYELVLQLN